MNKYFHKIFNLQIINVFGLIFCLVYGTSCESIIEERRAPLGEIWVNIDGDLYRYNTIGNEFPEDAHGYTSSIRYLSLLRRVTGNEFNNVFIQVSDFDIDSTLPLVHNDAQITINFSNGQKYEGKDGRFVLTIENKTDDILTGTFQGRIQNTNFARENYPISGSFKIQIQRF